MDVLHDSSHFIFSMMALPGESTFTVASLGRIRALLMTKATPAEACGFVGSGEFMMSRFLLKQALIWSRRSWSRCISCSASTAIFSLYIILLIDAHFSIRVMFSLWEVAPFTFREVIFMFAFPFVRSWFYDCRWCACAVL